MFTTFFLQFNTSSNLPPKVFGCPVFDHIHAYHRGKLDPRALKCVFVGINVSILQLIFFLSPWMSLL